MNEARIKKLEGTIRRRDKQIEKLQKEVEAKQKHLDRVKNDLLPPVYREIKKVTDQRDAAKADVSVIQAWICAIMLHKDITEISISDALVSGVLQEFKLKAEKSESQVTLRPVKVEAELQ
jgi:uncharacterized coiled-coil protein SlyX